jgi:hypothetical protein
MQRRTILASAATAPLISSAAAQSGAPAPKYLELSWIKMRNTPDNQRRRLGELLEKHLAPALKRMNAQPWGFFSSTIAPDAPFALLVFQYDSLNGMLEFEKQIRADEALTKALTEYAGGPVPYVRNEVWLLEGFKTFPAIEVPPGDAKRPGRIFELRIYESNTQMSLAKKIGMFDNGEIDLFRKTGLLPVFFGKTIAGGRMPNLTYMVAFDNLAAREANWRTFATSPEWKKLAATPGLSDGEVVSNITNMILSPMPGSMIR